MNVFEIGQKYWLRLNDGEHWAICIKENKDFSYLFSEDGIDLIVTSKNIEKYLKI